MSSKETPKKVYRSFESGIDLTACRICRAVGDPSHRKNIFKPSNQALLKIAEHLCEHPIVYDPSLPRLVCRPCERRLNNCLELQKVIHRTEETFQQHSGSTRVKRCINVSPSVSRPQKSRVSSTKSARTTLCFDVPTQGQGSSLHHDKENVNRLQDGETMLKVAINELMNVARRDMPSVLRNRSYGGLCQSNWMTEVKDEISSRCPTVAHVLSTLLGCDLAEPGRNLPPICLIYSIIMFMRCKELSRIQRINTVLLTEGKATTNLMDRFNKYGLCVTSSRKYVIFDEIGRHFLDHAVELVKSGMKFVYVIDNIDWEEKAHDMREHHQNKSVHAVATSMVFSRIPNDHLTDDGPQKDVTTCNFREVVSIGDDEMKSLRSRYKMFVVKTLIEHFPKLSSLKLYLTEELLLKHEHSTAMEKKSEVMTLPVLMKDEKKYADCVAVLDQLETWTHDIYEASGLYPNAQVASDADLVEVPTRPDQPRSHIPPRSAPADPLKGVKIPCFGDELTRVRFAGARDLRSGCHTAKQRLDHLYPYRIVGWHTKRSFLKSIFKRLYKSSSRENGTVRYFREVLNRRKVTLDVKHFEDCEQLFMSIGHCYLIEALLQFFRMDNINESPKENDPLPADEAGEEQKKIHVLAVLEKFLDEYISLKLPQCCADGGADSDGPDSDNGDLDGADPDSGDSDGADPDYILNYAVNLLSSYMILLDCKHAVASGNGEHLALVQKQMLYHFVSVPRYNAYAIEMLISTIQNDVLLSQAEAHHCKWAALVNWKGGNGKNIEIDLLQENRNKDIKGLIHLMGANKTEKAIERMSKAAGGVRKIINVFEEQASIKAKSSAHSHRSSSEDEKKMSTDLRKLKPFSSKPGRTHASFIKLSSNPLEGFNEKKFGEWLKRHQKNIAVHFPTTNDDISDDDISDDDISDDDEV